MVVLMSLAPRTNVREALGVVVDEVNSGIDINNDNIKCLRYPLPDMDQFDIAEYLLYNELQLIAGDPGDVNFDSITDNEME